MKICYIGSNAPRLVNLLNDMKDRGHEVHWIALDIPKYTISNIIIHDSIRVYGRRVIERYLLAPYFIFLLKNKIRQISPDIVHAINVEWAGWFSVLSGSKNVIVTAQGGDVRMSQERAFDIFHRWLRRYTIRNASVVTYGNDAMLIDIEHWETPKSTFKYFAGINFDLFNLENSSNELRHKLGVGNKKIIFSPRTFVPNSNLDILIQTIPIVKKSFPDVVYIFASHFGSKKYSLWMNELIDKLNVRKNCLFLDRIDPTEMVSYYSISDVVVSILSSDGMPASLLESMSMKKILVISKIPSYLDLMKKDYALFVDHRDEQGIAKAIIKSLTQDEKTDQMKDIAYNWVRKNADIKKLNDSLEKLYHDLIVYR